MKKESIISDFDPSKFDSSWLSGEKGMNRIEFIYERMQQGLIYPSPHATFVTCWSSSQDMDITRKRLSDVLVNCNHFISGNCPHSNTTVIVGVNVNIWEQICVKEQRSIPIGIKFSDLKNLDSGRVTSTVFERSNGAWIDSQGDLWFHIKSDKEDCCDRVLEVLVNEIEEKLGVGKIFAQKTYSRTQDADKRKGKVLGRRFSENINNPTDPLTIANQCLVGYEDVEHIGASYVLSQNFVIDWKALHSLSDTAIENVVGRKTDDTIIPSSDVRTHIKSARARDEFGNTIQILRLGLPFGHSQLPDVDSFSISGSNRGDEAGIYFAGFSKSIQRLETVMDGMIGHFMPFMTDRMFDHIKSTVGGFFYIPSTDDLDLPKLNFSKKDNEKWSIFPGVNWERLDRHFYLKSASDYFFYNSFDYIFRMATCSTELRDKLQPPSHRILHLLSDMFSRWRDNWYFNRKQEEMKNLEAYLKEFYDDETARSVMQSSVAIRKGWATRIMLKIYATGEYGFRGTKTDLQTFARINGADTFRIHPQEIIVGGMENLSLSQGRYVIEYLNESERLSGFFKTLSEASGVGHIVPDFGYLMKAGLQSAIDELSSKSENQDRKKGEFFKSVELALLGVQEWTLSYAGLAETLANNLREGEAAEKDNLLKIAARMNRLAKMPPSNFIEATQFLFTLHCCIHLTGEPTAIGRFDQILWPYYEQDLLSKTLTEDEAQEIIDCFFIKIGEKVQQNRLNIEDHQPYGNMAMGGTSGPYPKGGSTNQWIHQLTVGGIVADGELTEKPAYNKLTTLVLRASRRLPLNAPCVSLRVRKDMPDEYLKEAAKAILSGGAHPILINDDKVISGLVDCGKQVGGDPDHPDSVFKQSQGKWNSAVDLRSARNYACDGCYEPQYPGENWFSLGGFTTLMPLECALNMGKTWALAGPSWYRGQLLSYKSVPPAEIKDFESLVELYFRHFYLLYAKQVDAQLSGYGALAGFCPSPLLSALMPSCLERGRDLNDGGSRYNVYAPCFVGLASAINSLYNIKKMVFERDTAVTSLAELVECLICDWGNKMIEPFISDLTGPIRKQELSERFSHLRKIALSLPKYGTGCTEIDSFGNDFIERVANVCLKVYRNPAQSTKEKMIRHAVSYGSGDAKFGIQIQPGVGTFASFVENGQGSGASADGRLSGEALPSDLSPSPSPMDQPAVSKPLNIIEVLKGFTGSGTDAMWNFAPTDLNITEDFSEADLVSVLKLFSSGMGSNLLTITCGSRDTLLNASSQPEQYDLLRARMGGWTEFFVAMFPDKQRQHQRRPLMDYHL